MNRRGHVYIAMLAGLVLFLFAAVARSHDGSEPVGELTGALSFFDPAPLGIGYEWVVDLERRQTAQAVHAVGAKSWSEPSNPEGLKGWTHTSNWIAIDLKDSAAVRITVERQQGVVVVSNNVARAARYALVPALTLYRGWDDTTESEAHTFNNTGNFWSTIVYMGHADNLKGKSRVSYRTKLPAGKYSLVVGGNPPALGDPSDYPDPTCDPVDVGCYRYTGLQGYRVTIQAK